jgi:hypothetical protein
VHQVGKQLRLYYEARSTQKQDKNYYFIFFHVYQEYCCMLHSYITILSIILFHVTIYYMNTEILEILWCKKLLEIYYFFLQEWKCKPRNMSVIPYHAGYTYSEQVYKVETVYYIYLTYKFYAFWLHVWNTLDAMTYSITEFSTIHTSIKNLLRIMYGSVLSGGVQGTSSFITSILYNIKGEVK